MIIFLTDIYAILNPFNLAIFSRFTEISYAAKLFWDAAFFLKGWGKNVAEFRKCCPRILIKLSSCYVELFICVSRERNRLHYC